RHRSAGPRELGERRLVCVAAREVVRGEFRGGRVRVGIEHGDLVAERARGGGEHSPQLAASEEAQRGTGKDHRTSGSCIAATCSRSFARWSASFVASVASAAASRLTAKS